ncbi:MAG: hypothetical protein JWM53_3481 [bacterium]|nr:hypothetical protein [bacterium]
MRSAEPRLLGRYCRGREYGTAMRLRKYLSLSTLVVALGAFSATAAAQYVPAPLAAASAHGSGIRLGDAMILHVGLGIEFDYDTNVFYQNSGVTGAFLMRLAPGFDLSNSPRGAGRTIDFDLHGGLSYVEYLTADASLSAHRQFAVDAGVRAAFFGYSPYNFTLFDNFVRSTQPPYTKVDHNLDRDTNELGVRANLSPGGGRLTLQLGYLFGLDYFEPNQLQAYDLFYHRFDARLSWKFFPKTALYIDATEVINRYQNPSNHPNSYPLHVVAGVQGLITAKLTVNAWVGYGNGFYVVGPNPNTALGGLQLAWKPTALSTGVVGYEHDFQNSLLGSYYDIDLVYISWTQLIWRFTGFLRLSYANERFKGVLPEQATTDGTDNYITFNTRVDYPFREWLIGSAGYDMYFNTSDRTLMVATTVPGTVPVNFLRHVAYVRLTFQY